MRHVVRISLSTRLLLTTAASTAAVSAAALAAAASPGAPSSTTARTTPPARAAVAGSSTHSSARAVAAASGVRALLTHPALAATTEHATVQRPQAGVASRRAAAPAARPASAKRVVAAQATTVHAHPVVSHAANGHRVHTAGITATRRQTRSTAAHGTSTRVGATHAGSGHASATRAHGTTAKKRSTAAHATSSTATRSAATRAANRTSDNWSGYTQSAAELHRAVTSVSGSWQVPKAWQRQRGREEVAADWIGIGGTCTDPKCTKSDPTLIQAGDATTVGRTGAASTFTWVETLPSQAVQTPVAAHSGDRLSVAIARASANHWKIQLANATTGKSWSTAVRYRSSMNSADWVVERPQVQGAKGVESAAFPNRTPTSFRSARVNGAPAHFRSSQKITMASGGRTIAATSAPESHQDGFSVCAYASACGAHAHR